MRIEILLLATALICGTAFAAAPNDTAKSPADTSADAAKPSKALKGPVKTVKKQAVKRQQAANRADARRMGAAGVETDLNDSARQTRIDEALAKYRQQGS